MDRVEDRDEVRTEGRFDNVVSNKFTQIIEIVEHELSSYHLEY